MMTTVPETPKQLLRAGFLALGVTLSLVAVGEVGGLLTVAGIIAAGDRPPVTSSATMPPSGDTAAGDLEASPRRGEFVDVTLTGSPVPIRAWVVYHERAQPAPVVMVLHDTYRLSDWVRAIADRFAAEGFVAVAPDLWTGVAPADLRVRVPDAWFQPTCRIFAAGERTMLLDAVRTWALDHPATNGRLSVVGFGSGGTASFAYAMEQPALDAVVVFYGSTPDDGTRYGDITAPVLGFYGGDLPSTATVPLATDAMAAAGSPTSRSSTRAPRSS